MCFSVIKDCAYLICISADAPIKDIHSFIGTFTLNKPPVPLGNDLPLHALPPSVSPLTAENLLWSNTVLAAGSAVGFVVYTGAETRAVMNTSHPKTKVGLLDLEINRLSKVRFPCLKPLQLVTFFLDLVCRYLCALSGSRSAEWVPRALVYLRLPVLDFVLLHHPD